MKRTKEVQDMVNFFNSYIKNNQIKKENETLAVFGCCLINAGQYNGFIFRKNDDTIGNEDNYDYIEYL